MKISHFESDRASASKGAEKEKILPKDRPKGLVSSRPATSRQLSPLEKGMLVAEAAMAGTPDIREDIVKALKERVEKGDYEIDGQEVADMMLRRLAADRIR